MIRLFVRHPVTDVDYPGLGAGGAAVLQILRGEQRT